MKGGIYSDQKCFCGQRFRHYETRGVWCSNHPTSRASRFVVRFGNITRRFCSYKRAFRFLTGLRFETDTGKFDPRDYRKEHPLGFENCAGRFIQSKRDRGLRAWKKYEERIRFGINLWGNRSVKEIKYGDVEDFLSSLQCSTKYKYDIICTIRMLFNWLHKREEIAKIPNLPSVPLQMNYRKILTKEQQWQVLEQLRKMTCDFNPRIYIGCLFLATYPAVRPGELIRVKEKDIDLRAGRIWINRPKTGEGKFVYLIEPDIGLLQELPVGFPQLYFFRHIKGIAGAKPGQKFGPSYLSRWWKRACNSLGIEGVPIYPGTKHTTLTHLRHHRGISVDDCKEVGQVASKAIERYLIADSEKIKRLCGMGRNELQTKSEKAQGV